MFLLNDLNLNDVDSKDAARSALQFNESHLFEIPDADVVKCPRLS
jgi:hypothetical protein